jgi:predicted PurR-regulated permease PerM
LALEKVRHIFKTYDVDNSGALDKMEFREVMMVLFGNVLLRVLVQWSMTLLIVPLVAQQALDGIYWLWARGGQWIADHMEQYSDELSNIEVMWDETRDELWDKTPSIVHTTIHQIQTWIKAVPDSIWNTIPLTLLSCILGIVFVPWMIFNIDDYFQRVADKKHPTVVPPPPSAPTTTTALPPTPIRTDKKTK